jgi:hypothetical protein
VQPKHHFQVFRCSSLQMSRVFRCCWLACSQFKEPTQDLPFITLFFLTKWIQLWSVLRVWKVALPEYRYPVQWNLSHLGCKKVTIMISVVQKKRISECKCDSWKQSYGAVLHIKMIMLTNINSCTHATRKIKIK